MFTHKRKGMADHQHETVAQARCCEADPEPTHRWVGGMEPRLEVTTPEPMPYKGRMVTHESPCVCGPYDRCRELRAADAADSGNWRDQFRAYND